MVGRCDSGRAGRSPSAMARSAGVVLASALLASVCLVSGSARGFSFGIDATTEECFFEEIAAQKPVGIMFQVTQGGFLDVDIEIRAPDGRVVYTAEKQSEGKYNFVTHVPGQYHFCFSNKMSTLTPKTVSFQLNVDGDDGSGSGSIEHARLEDLTPLENSVMQIMEGFRAILDEQAYQKMRERTHRNTSESTNSRVVWWSFFEVVLLLSMSLWQIYYLRRLFETKAVV